MFIFPYRTEVYLEQSPIANWMIIAITMVVSFVGFVDETSMEKLSGAAYEGGFSKLELNLDDDLNLSVSSVEREAKGSAFDRYFAATITSNLVHTGFWHLIGNMAFLWAFGNAVNSRFGNAKYVGLYLVCMIGSSLFEYATGSAVAVGASGAIMGIVGAYLVYFPTNDITMAGLILIRPFAFTVSGFWVIGAYVLMDVIMLATDSAGATAVIAHISGFLIGFAGGFACLKTGFVESDQDERTLVDLFSKAA